ncbi:hypothetical protein ACSBR1_037135 [Camellia fascicularis]
MESEGFIFKALVFSSVPLIMVFYCALRVVYSIWWRPKTLEKLLKQQGIRGTSYKLLYGDIKEIKRLTQEAWSKPMPLNHQIAPRVFPFFYHMVQKYGKISMSWTERRPRLIIAEAEIVRLILNGDFEKPPLNPLLDLLTLGVNTLEGDKWAKRRRLISPAFHHHKLQGMVAPFSTSCCKLINGLKKLLLTPQGSSELDIATELQKFSVDVIARTAFGSSWEEGKQIFELQKEQIVLVIEASQAIYFPGLRFVPTKKNKRRYEIDNKIKGMLRNMIERREEAMRIGESEENDDLLGLLLQCKQGVDNEMSTEDVIEECKLFYFAGQETTANWLTWTIILLCMHPEWQSKAREEVLRFCGKTTPDLETIKHLKIVSMVLHEVLRLYPPVTGLFRYTRKRSNIGGMWIPEGVELYLATMMLHYDPKYWGEDVEEFKPERFSKGVSNATKEGEDMAFYPFGWGPRFCLGQAFAMIEAKLALAMLLQNFSFELSPSYTHAPYTAITLQPQHGAAIILHQI